MLVLNFCQVQDRSTGFILLFYKWQVEAATVSWTQIYKIQRWFFKKLTTAMQSQSAVPVSLGFYLPVKYHVQNSHTKHTQLSSWLTRRGSGSVSLNPDHQKQLRAGPSQLQADAKPFQ